MRSIAGRVLALTCQQRHKFWLPINHRYNLPIEHCSFWKLGKRGKLRELGREVRSSSSHQPVLAILDIAEGTEPIPLDLEQVIFRVKALAGAGEHWFDEGGQLGMTHLHLHHHLRMSCAFSSGRR